MKGFAVAIDGPSGAGKSTMARLVAERLGLHYVDTGAIYRTVGLFACQNGLKPDDLAGVTALLDRIALQIQFPGDGVQHMILNGVDVTNEIRTAEIARYASGVAAMPPVRALLLERQRELARAYGVIMDGRDIGTVVLPDADVKLYLTASAQERAKRRCLELRQKGQEADYETVLADMRRRDEADMTRTIAPLRKADDAVELDTSHDSIAETVEKIIAIIQEKAAI